MLAVSAVGVGRSYPIVAGVFSLAVLGYPAWRATRRRRTTASQEASTEPVAEPPLKTAEGPAVLGVEEGVGWGAATPFVRLGDVTFLLHAPGAREAFVAGVRYRAYYVDLPTRWLLSAERIP